MARRPSANDVLGAVTEAARLLSGPNDQGTATLTMDRARKVTAVAMREVFNGEDDRPRLTWTEIGRMIGGLGEGPDLDNLQAVIIGAKRAKWWSESAVEEIVGCFMALYTPEERL